MTTSISGTNFADDDGNGQRGTSLLVGDNPDVIIVLDKSGSTGDLFRGSEPIADHNSDGLSDTILDSEIAAAKAFHSYLLEGGYGQSNLGLISFDSESTILFDGLVENNSNDPDNFSDKLAQISSSGGTSFDQPLNKVKELVNRWESEQANIIFISDGFPNQGDGTSIASGLKELGHNLQSFGTGMGASKSALDSIDINGKSYVFYVPNELVRVLSGDLSEDVQRDDAVVYTEEGLKGNTVFVDLNGDGVLSKGEPRAITDAKGNYELEADVDAGSYDIRTISPTQGLLAGSAQVNIPAENSADVSVDIGSQSLDQHTPISLQKVKRLSSVKPITGRNKGKDHVKGTQSDDVLASGKGPDVLKGLSGNDQYLFNQQDIYGRKGREKIIGFNSGEDMIILGGRQFEGMERNPTFLSVLNRKELRKHAKEAVDFLYLESKGKLYYNANQEKDGFGDGGYFAQLANSTTLVADDLGWM